VTKSEEFQLAVDTRIKYLEQHATSRRGDLLEEWRLVRALWRAIHENKPWPVKAP